MNTDDFTDPRWAKLLRWVSTERQWFTASKYDAGRGRYAALSDVLDQAARISRLTREARTTRRKVKR